MNEATAQLAKRPLPAGRNICCRLREAQDMQSDTPMILINIYINVFNVLKFLVIEVLVSCILEPG